MMSEEGVSTVDAGPAERGRGTIASPTPCYIFLDFDGVLNSLRSLGAYKGFREEHLDPVAIRLVDRLCAELKAEGFAPYVVISSTWRMGRSVQWFTDFFASHNCTFKTIGKTPEFHDAEPMRRGREVADWMTRHGGDAPYVCIDDDSDFLPGQTLIHTTFDYGLQLGHLWQAFRAITGRDPPTIPRENAVIFAVPRQDASPDAPTKPTQGPNP